MNEFKRVCKSFKYAIKGIFILFSKEKNAHIHALAAILVTFLGFLFGITTSEWCIIILCFMVVMAAEGFNTSIEKVVDLVSPEYHPIAGMAKDIAAGAVLITAIGAAIIGLIIFIPYC